MPRDPNATGADIADQCELRCLERLEAEPNHHRPGDGHRVCTESRASFDKCAEAECDEQRLDPAILRKTGDFALSARRIAPSPTDIV
jgi:hypothetical protein